MQAMGTLVFYCGKMASGKSTRSARYAEAEGAVLISEDVWLQALYPEQISSVQDYVSCSARLKSVLQPHLQQLLQSGVTVVMDFPANTRDQRQWMLRVANEAGAPHQMFYLALSDEQCLAQLQRRRELRPERAHFDSDENFALITGFFEPPDRHEGLNMQSLSVDD